MRDDRNAMAKNDGFEKVDDRKVAVPAKFRSKPGEVDRLKELMASIVHYHKSEGTETFEESLDFDDPDDSDDPLSLGETRFMKEEYLLTEAADAGKVVRQRRDAANYRRKYYGKGESGTGSKGDGDRSARSGDVDHQRGSERESEGRSGEAASGGAGSSKGGGAN